MSIKSRKAREAAADDHLDPAAPVIPWPEWTDAELNGEKWDYPKNGTDGHFQDPEPRVMPPSIDQPHDWKRASLLKSLSSGLVVFTPRNEYPNFVKNNKHILHSEFVRWFISTMINLQYVGRVGLQIEGESPNFITPIDSRIWHGWLYVYSMNKAGSSASTHRPVVNPNGKYVVRLYFMGFWRRFIVDDMIPVDVNDTPLLPRTEIDFELWPMLLAKAMMKLAALSWTNEREIHDFHPVSCFTGWICLPLAAKYLSQNDKWQLLRKYGDMVGEVEMSPEMSPNKQSMALPSGKEKADNKKAKKEDPPLPILKDSHPKVVIFANISNVTEVGEENVVPEVTPCLSHPVYIDKLKDVGFGTSQMRWKMYRYFDWATKHGVFKGSGNGPGPGVRSLKLISPLKRCVKEGLVDESVEEESAEEASKVSGRIAAGAKETPDRDIVLPEIGVWADFGKISGYFVEILMFYKPSDFEYYARVSDLLRSTTAGELNQLHVSAAGSSRAKSSQANTGVKDGKKVHTVSASSLPSAPSFRSLFKWQQNVSSCRNEPLYMLVDSTDTKFFLIEFCSMPKPSPASTRSYLIVEKYDFFQRSTDDDDPVALIRTFSTGATIFEAQPGRHLYRVLFRSRSSYFVRILSDTIFHFGDRYRMHDLMTSESERIDAIAKNISNRINEAFQEFGKPGYASRLRAFYNSYMPSEEDTTRSNVQKKLTKNIHRLFIEELEIVVKETFPSVESEAICRALRVFFINVSHREAESKKSTEYSTSERAAVRIQSFFRMALVKMYKKMHDPSHIRHPEILQNLRKVVELFNFSKRESIAGLLIRKIIWSTSVDRSPVYPCHPDLNHVLKIEEWKGVLRNVQPGQWVPILRVVLNAPTLDSVVHAGIDLVTILPRHVIRVVNNETYREVTRLVNAVAPSRYPHVKRGYTLIGYGWSEGQKFKELDWSVRVTTVKGQPTFRQILRSSPSFIGAIKPPSLAVQEFSNNYIPNVRNVIGKWIVTVSSDSIVSFRLTTSYSMVETVITISDKDGKVFCEATGGSVLILPAVYLSLIEKSTNGKGSGDARKALSPSESLILDSAKEDQDQDATAAYYVQAYVANDSWPLTSTEWTVAKEAKARGTVYDPMYGRTSVSSVSKRGMKLKVPAGAGRGSEDKLHGDGDMKSDSASRTIFQHPLCRLQVLVDLGSKVQVEQDRIRETEIAGMKKLWEDAEPSRLLRGRELREEFFRSNSNVSTRSTSSEESIQESLSTMETRTLKPPSNLPPWNIAAYVSKDDEDDEEDRWVKTEGDEEMLRNQRAINIIDFNEAQATYLDEEMALIEEQRQRHTDQLDSYLDKVAYWKSLVDIAYEKRDSYVASVKSALSPSLIKNGQETNTKKKKNRKKAK